MNATRIIVQEDDFCIKDEYAAIRRGANSDGAIVTFSGIVREQSDIGNLVSMTLEHYPEMTEKSLQNICNKARERWTLGAITLIHRVGTLHPDEQIVFVGVSSKHRKSAFQAAMFIMDYLKKEAPFWKKESSADEARWVDAKVSDHEAAKAWD
ncbi:molybdopterin synthase catalytic subunit MoaE [Glaciecola sp. MH2013]|uniref:molybdopterin synthase catalytic subunit MoaE n=1 Tax=Glaciecola sp. MH2013 TaxID=2785524 RepID=UPI00189C6605|nr:molybdopterin synthase catalytic subunit MoaE [Glaciecola sp. MH2013]MBF7072752.1 molybdopterin synthase catalytic subunit MoaE [Glaciecola sp. MH2013]